VKRFWIRFWYYGLMLRPSPRKKRARFFKAFETPTNERLVYRGHQIPYLQYLQMLDTVDTSRASRFKDHRCRRRTFHLLWRFAGVASNESSSSRDPCFTTGDLNAVLDGAARREKVRSTICDCSGGAIRVSPRSWRQSENCCFP
jgi:hypothetical protein